MSATNLLKFKKPWATTDYDRLIKEPGKDDLSDTNADDGWPINRPNRPRALLYWQLSNLIFALIAGVAMYIAWHPVASDDFKKTDFGEVSLLIESDIALADDGHDSACA